MALRTPSDLDRQLGAFLKATMKKNGWSYNQLSSETAVPKSMLHHLVNGERGASLSLVSRICHNLKVELSDVFPKQINRHP